MRLFCGTVAAAIALYAYIPYARHILQGRVQPARSARLMLCLLLIIALAQQRIAGSTWTLAVTAGEAVGSLGILALSLRHGTGGLRKVDLACYGLLVIDAVLWVVTKRPVAGLCLTIAADLTAFAPVLVKTWRRPRSETPVFYILGAVAPVFSIVAGGRYAYEVMLFPLYLCLVNALEAVLIYRVALSRRICRVAGRYLSAD